MRKKVVSLICAVSMMAVALTGCGGAKAESKDAGSGTSQAKTEEISGKVTLAGSTSMEKLCGAMSESFMAKYPGITVTAEYTGSGAGLESLAAGSVDIGNSSRHLKEEETGNGAVENVVAIDGIATIVDKKNTVTDITAEELAKVYTGKVKNWKELGGPDESVVVIGREAGSGTRDAFEELLEIPEKCKYAQELDSTGAVLAKVSSTPGAIGYVSLDVVDDTVTALSVNGVKPDEKEILAGKYLLSRPFVMATKGEIDKQSDCVKTWFDYIHSDEGKNVIKKVGLIVPEQE